MESEKDDRWLIVNALSGGAGAFRAKHFMAMSAAPCIADPADCNRSIHFLVSAGANQLEVSREEFLRLCDELRIDTAFVPPEVQKPISTTAN